MNDHVVDPLKIIDFTPIRDRQKLLREQGVLAQVFDLLKAPFMPRQGSGEVQSLLSSPQELTELRNEVFQKMFQLCYSLLKYSQVGYRKNQVSYYFYFIITEWLFWRRFFFLNFLNIIILIAFNSFLFNIF